MIAKHGSGGRFDQIGEMSARQRPPEAGDEEFSIESYRRLVAEQGVAAFRRDWPGHPLAKLRSADEANRALLARMLARYPARDLAGPGGPPPQAAGKPALAALRKPVLVVNGALDMAARLRAGEALAGALPLAERVVLPGAGHLPNLDVPAAYNDALRSFLRRQALAAA